MCFTKTPQKVKRERLVKRAKGDCEREERERERERVREKVREEAIKCRPWARGRHRGKEAHS